MSVQGTSSTSADKALFRPDLEGLRGLAILLVLAFHAGIPGFGGGFIGVDVFFVLSGFLITGLLLREHERNGRISVINFYVRRARRILPASLVVIALTMIAATFLVPPLNLLRFAGDAVASALSIGNIHFAGQSTNYFAAFVASTAPSPFLHYWSLGVEEQFYLLWPALLILSLRGHQPRLMVAITLQFVLVISLLLAIQITTIDAPAAFYLLPFRAWQLAAGGLLAVLPFRSTGRYAGRVLVTSGWFGLVIILAAGMVLINANTPYPGIAAILPTVGAMGLIASGARPWSPGRLLQVRPMRFLGRISFSLYLVHWPIFVLPLVALPLGAELPLPVRVALAAVAVLLGWLSWRFVEQPFQRSRHSVANKTPSPRLALRTFSVAGMAILVIVVLSNLLGANALAEINSSGSSQGNSGTEILSAAVRPLLSQASNDWEQINADGCELGETRTSIPSGCIYGDPHGATTIALVGDSHAAQWFPALNAIAKEQHWRLAVLVKFSCRFEDIPQYLPMLNRDFTECTTWHSQVVARLQELSPALIVVSAASYPDAIDPADNSPVIQGQAMGRLLGEIPNSKVAIIVDTPIQQYDPPACLSAHKDDITSCATPRSVAFGPDRLIPETTTAAILGPRASVVDLSNLLCSPTTCPVVLNNYIVYRDRAHLTATFSASLAPVLAAQLPKI